MQMLDSTIVNTALPSMAAGLGESPLRMQSVVIAYALTMAMLIPASGYLADRFGTKRIFLAAIALFTLGSLLCANSHTLRELVASRVVQGIGGSMLLPVGRLAVLRSFPRGDFLRAMSFGATHRDRSKLCARTLSREFWQIKYFRRCGRSGASRFLKREFFASTPH